MTYGQISHITFFVTSFSCEKLGPCDICLMPMTLIVVCDGHDDESSLNVQPTVGLTTSTH